MSRKAIGDEFVIIGIARDLTEQKKILALMERAERMEAMGRLAGGIAHDFNNILVIIIGYATILQKKIGGDSPLNIDLDKIAQSGKRGAELIKNLMTLGKKQEIALKEVDLNDIVNMAKNLFLNLFKKNVKLSTNLSTGKLMVMADAGQMENVLINLAINARDAMPEGGRLSIETRDFEPDVLFNRALGLTGPGRYALLSISDTGVGMDEKTKMRIFEPFFTTKEKEKGTGLGLSIAYGTVKQHNGYIDVQSEKGKGTTFNIYLPLIGTNRNSGGGDRVSGAGVHDT